MTTPRTHELAGRMLAREASLAELYGRSFEIALGRGDPDAARRWNRRYRLAASHCRRLGALRRAREGATAQNVHQRLWVSWS